MIETAFDSLTFCVPSATSVSVPSEQYTKICGSIKMMVLKENSCMSCLLFTESALFKHADCFHLKWLSGVAEECDMCSEALKYCSSISCGLSELPLCILVNAVFACVSSSWYVHLKVLSISQQTQTTSSLLRVFLTASVIASYSTLAVNHCVSNDWGKVRRKNKDSWYWILSINTTLPANL